MFCVEGACFPGTTMIFPPSLRALLAWSTMFRCAATFQNYVGYVRTACLLAGVPTTSEGLRGSSAKERKEFNCQG
eukprot:329901-Karenia_brevis.AAC.1